MQTYLISRFALADLAFTFLPIAVIAGMRWATGMLTPSFLIDPEWSFAAIIVFGLAMTRILELKVKYQRDHSERLFALARICILGLVAAVIGLALSQMRVFGVAVSVSGLLLYQFTVLFVGVALLYMAHWSRVRFLDERDSFLPGTDRVRYLHFIEQDARVLRSRVDELNVKVAKRDAFPYEGVEQEADLAASAQRREREIGFLVTELGESVHRLKTSYESWTAPMQSSSSLSPQMPNKGIARTAPDGINQ